MKECFIHDAGSRTFKVCANENVDVHKHSFPDWRTLAVEVAVTVAVEVAVTVAVIVTVAKTGPQMMSPALTEG